uniref:Rhamnose-binding lectin n=1 Tax=Magallana gigas TaxID=29159 RepID=K1RZ18_MAGGI
MWKYLVLIAVFLVILQGTIQTACENKGIILHCGMHQVLHVFDAMYGREDKHTCSRSGKHKSTSCTARNVLKKVKSKCNGRRSCRLRARNSVFGDPCHGTLKYLRVRYECRRRYRFRHGWWHVSNPYTRGRKIYSSCNGLPGLHNYAFRFVFLYECMGGEKIFKH